MPRLPRIQMDGAIYYVTAKGLHDQLVFKDKTDYQTYLELLAKYKAQYQFKLFSYCLLPDRIHLLVETTGSRTISQIMHDLNSLYTKHFNNRYERRGHLFEARFKSVLVEKMRFLLGMTRHIHLAPEKILVTYGEAEGIGSSKDYPFSSLDAYMDISTGIQKPINLSNEVSEVKGLLGDASYHQFLGQAPAEEEDYLEKKLKRGGILGSETFENLVRNRIKDHVDAMKVEEETVSKKLKFRGRLLLALGCLVLFAAGMNVYFYQQKNTLQNKYETLLQMKEVQFEENSRFENRSPLFLNDLEGTVWQVEMVSTVQGSDTGRLIQDVFRFSKGKVWSEKLGLVGFGASNYTLSDSNNGMKVWETLQSSENGAQASLRGDWKGDAMKGIVSVQNNGQVTEEYSFFSVKWSYQS